MPVYNNGVTRKVELCKRLKENRLMMSAMDRKVAVKLLCSVVRLEQDIEHLHLQSRYVKD